jgi:hypothetical protein
MIVSPGEYQLSPRLGTRIIQADSARQVSHLGDTAPWPLLGL